jgi:hypothetical protein
MNIIGIDFKETCEARLPQRPLLFRVGPLRLEFQCLVFCLVFDETPYGNPLFFLLFLLSKSKRSKVRRGGISSKETLLFQSRGFFIQVIVTNN